MTESTTLTEEQQAAYDRVLSADPGEFLVLRGFAGTGKTWAASTMINSGRFNKPLVLAPTAAALNSLKRKFSGNVPEGTQFSTLAYRTSTPRATLRVGDPKTSGFKINLDCSYNAEGTADDGLETLKRWGEKLHRIDVSPYVSTVRNPEDKRCYRTVDTVGLSEATRNTPITESPEFDKINDQAIAERLIQDQFDIVVIDEYSMVGQYDHELLVSVAEKVARYPHGPVFVACGDAGQLQPVNATINDFIRRPVDHRQVFELTVPMRSDDEIAQFASRIRKGAHLGGMAASPNPLVESFSGKLDDLFVEHAEQFDEADVVISFKNDTVARLNRLIRARRGFSGGVNVGEPVMVSRNVYAGKGVIEWANGDTLTVTEVHDLADYLPEIGSAVESEMESVQFEAEMETDPQEKAIAENRVQQLGAGLSALTELSKFGEIALVTLSDGFGTDTSDRWALIRADMGASRAGEEQKLAKRLASLLWRHSVKSINDIAYLWQTPNPVKLVEVVPAYAITVHKSQGSEAGSVIYIAAKGELWYQAKSAWDGQEWHPPYTAVTRAKERVKVFYTTNKIDNPVRQYKN